MIKNPYRTEARRRWPDGPDMVSRVEGTGRWATVSWCAGLLVVLHQTKSQAIGALAAINDGACGHSCWRDHELIDLAAPETLDLDVERWRGDRRDAHFATCRTCLFVFWGKARQATRLRTERRCLASTCAA